MKTGPRFRSEFIEVVCKAGTGEVALPFMSIICPDDEHRYADECLIEFMKTVELGPRVRVPHSPARCSTNAPLESLKSAQRTSFTARATLRQTETPSLEGHR